MEYIYHLVMLMGIFMIASLGLNLINGIAGQLSLGHAGFWAIGGYAGASYAVFASLPLPTPINLLISAIIGFLASAIAGAFVGIPCLRLRGDYLAIATLGFGEITRIVIMNMEVVGGASGFTNIPKWSHLVWIYLWVGVVLFFIINLLRGTHGRAILSVREDEIAAKAMGIPTVKYKLFVFIMGAGIAGISGSLFAHMQQLLHPNNFTFLWSVIFLLMIILGGLGSITGAIVGTLILGLLPELLRHVSPSIAEWRMVIYALLLIGLMLWRPSGILGKRELNLLSFFQWLHQLKKRKIAR